MRVTKNNIFFCGTAVSLSGFLGLVSGAGSQNPFGQANVDSLQGAGSQGSQNPFGSNTGTGSAPGSQNPFGQNTQNPGSGNQNPFGSDSGSGGNPGSGTLADGVGCPATQAPAPASANGLVYASPPVCPSGDGKLYQSPDGATFFIQCCMQGPPSPIRSFIAPDFKTCMDECSKTKGCRSVQYAAQTPQGSTEPLHECKLYQPGDYSNTKRGANDMHNYAFVIDPPAIESPDLATILCSTECPYADGQQFVTSAGEAFRIDCSRRHGTKVLYQDSQESLEACIEACGKLVACHSVDYDTQRKTCYYGNHHGQPTISAASFASAYSMGCAGACSKESEGCCK